MRFIPLVMGLLLASSAMGTDTRLLEKARPLPLALDDAFQFRKVQTVTNDKDLRKKTSDPMVNFEFSRLDFGAVTAVERQAREGQYFRFHWKAKRPAPITVRFEYRQTNLGSYVQAREIHYDRAKGSMETEFQVVGDDYHTDGRVNAWRALLIEDGKIVGLTQSFLWN